MSKQKNLTKGFTIIEVLIVLAIAGLILLVVFLAVPALQRNSRNTQRKNDVSVILGALAEFSANKAGKLPGTYDAADLEFQVVAADANGTGVEPKLGLYDAATEVVFAANNNTAIAFATPITTTQASNLYVNTGAKCNATGTNVGGTGATSRSLAVTYVVETSGGTASVCQES